jgi:preprotein translocase subunit SecF
MLAGVYSTVFIATPVVLLWHRNKTPELRGSAAKTSGK